MYAFYIVENVWTLLIRLKTFTEIFRILTKITFLDFGGFNNASNNKLCCFTTFFSKHKQYKVCKSKNKY